MMSSFYQYGSVIHFIQGVYDGEMTCNELLSKGDTGLGTFNAVDGEMVVVDGIVYRVDAQGMAQTAPGQLKTPFAAVSFFDNSDQSFQVKHIASLSQMNQILDSKLPTLNVFYMLRINAFFERIDLRSENCQISPYQPLSETLPELQYEFTLEQVRGTLIVTRCPDYTKGCTIQGYHYHFINEEKQRGGHVFDFNLREGLVDYQLYRQFEMELPNNDLFDQSALNIDIDQAMKKIE